MYARTFRFLRAVRTHLTTARSVLLAALSYGRQIDCGIVATSCDDQRAPLCQAMRIGACAADWPRANQLAGWMRTRVWSSSAAGACGVFAGAGCAAGVAAGASGAAR